MQCYRMAESLQQESLTAKVNAFCCWLNQSPLELRLKPPRNVCTFVEPKLMYRSHPDKLNSCYVSCAARIRVNYYKYVVFEFAELYSGG